MEKDKKIRVGRSRIPAGHSLFAFNTKTGEIINMGKPRRVDIQEGCVYRTALNAKNFVKKLNKLANAKHN